MVTNQSGGRIVLRSHHKLVFGNWGS